MFSQDGKKSRIKSAMQSTVKVPYESVAIKNTPTSQSREDASTENNENKLPTKEEIEARIKKEEEEF